MALSFLGKKTFDPKRPDQVQRVFDAERKVIEEQRKMHELQKTLRAEREQETLEKLHAAAHGKPPKQERLDWMYQGAAAAGPTQDDYLLGRAKVDDAPVPADVAASSSMENAASAPNTSAAAAPGASSRRGDSSASAPLPSGGGFSMRVEDPMFAVMATESAERASALSDPLTLQRLREKLLAESLVARDAAESTSSKPGLRLSSRWGDAKPESSQRPLARETDTDDGTVGGSARRHESHHRQRASERASHSDGREHRHGSRRRHGLNSRHRTTGDDCDGNREDDREGDSGRDDTGLRGEGRSKRHRGKSHRSSHLSSSRRSRRRRHLEGDSDGHSKEDGGGHGSEGSPPAEATEGRKRRRLPDHTAPASALTATPSSAAEAVDVVGVSSGSTIATGADPDAVAGLDLLARPAGYGLQLPASKAYRKSAARPTQRPTLGPSAAMVVSRNATLERMREAGGAEAKVADALQGRQAAAVPHCSGWGGNGTAPASAGVVAPKTAEEAIAAMLADGDALAAARRARAQATLHRNRLTDQEEKEALMRDR